MKLEINSIRRVKTLFIGKQISFGILIIIIGVIIAQIVMQQEDAAHLVNLSSRQGMLCQRMAKNSMILVHSGDSQTVINAERRLREDAQLFRKVHIGLQEGSNSLNLSERERSGEIKALYSRIFFYYNNFLESVNNLLDYRQEKGMIDDSDPVAGAYLQIVLNNEPKFLRLMDKITRQFDTEARSRIELIENSGMAALAILIVVLFIGVRYIYSPGFKSINKLINELHVSEEKYRQLFEFMPEMVIISENEIIRFVNPYGLKLLGAESESDIIGKSIIEFASPTMKDSLKNRIKNISGGKVTGPIEFTLMGLTDKKSYVELNSIPILYDDKNALLSVARDITERKKTEKALIESEMKYRSVVNSVKEVIFQLDKYSRFKVLNPAWKRITGIEAFEALGVEFTKFVCQEYRGSFDSAFNKMRSGEIEFYRAELEIRNCKNNIIWIEFNALSTFNSRGRFKGIAGTMLDITERKAAEKEIQSYIIQLEEQNHLIEQNAEELSRINDQLKESENKLREINASKDKFFSIIAHDLKSPFTSLLGLSELLHTDIESLSRKEIGTFSGNIYKTSQNVYSLIENLLEWSRIQTGRIRYEPEVFNINKVINRVIDLIEAAAVKKGINISAVLDDDHNVYADINMVETVLRNLIANAVKFTYEGGSIKVKTVSNSDLLYVSVKDTGVGMDAVQLESIFEIDSNSSTTGTGGETGTGLGLILCKEFVERNGGEITVESTPGEGTKFVFNLRKY